MAEFFIKYHTNRSLKKNLNARSTVPFTKARKVGILFTAGGKEKFLKVKELYTVLKNEGKDVEVMTHLLKGTQNHEFLFKIFDKDGFNFMGKVIDEDLQQFIETDFDYLLHLDTEPTTFTDYILANTHSRCRVGKYDSERNELYELMLNVKDHESYNQLVDQISYYTRRITNE